MRPRAGTVGRRFPGRQGLTRALDAIHPKQEATIRMPRGPLTRDLPAEHPGRGTLAGHPPGVVVDVPKARRHVVPALLARLPFPLRLLLDEELPKGVLQVAYACVKKGALLALLVSPDALQLLYPHASRGTRRILADLLEHHACARVPDRGCQERAVDSCHQPGCGRVPELPVIRVHLASAACYPGEHESALRVQIQLALAGRKGTEDVLLLDLYPERAAEDMLPPQLDVEHEQPGPRGSILENILGRLVPSCCCFPSPAGNVTADNTAVASCWLRL
mmetsp:Transcript_38972/g.110367  ORF Transcript_38972/g.110367 Transcript_38972/m.110367 type:complete len:277 (-) Transcript_38972:1656-2486(-)